jgi:hypothetical protein
MHILDEEVNGPDADRTPGVAAAVEVALAPLKVAQVFDPVADYVLHGTGPGVLERLRERPRGTEMVAEPNYHPTDLAAAVTELHPGWNRREAEVARRTVYRTAPVDVLARFGQVLHAASDRVPEHGEPSWLLVLADDVGRAGNAPAGRPCTPPCRHCCTRNPTTGRATGTRCWRAMRASRSSPGTPRCSRRSSPG